MYLEWFSKTLLDLGYRVTAFGQKPKELREWMGANFVGLSDRFHAEELQPPDPRPFPLNKLDHLIPNPAYWCHTADVIRRSAEKTGAAVDLVFFLWLDGYLRPLLNPREIDRIFPFDWSGLYFHPKHLRTRRPFLVRLLQRTQDAALHSDHCQSVAILDEGVADRLQSRLSEKPVIVFPDFTDESPPDPDFSIVGAIHRASKGRKIIGLLGSQAKYKGMMTLIEVARRSPTEDCFFVFAGKLADHSFSRIELERIKSISDNPPENCFFNLDPISNEPQFNALVRACDILFAAYIDFPHSSNILAKAAIFRKPVIVSENYCMAERVKKYRLGLTVREGDAGDCMRAISQLIKGTGPDGEPPDFDGYKKFHSIERLKRQLLDLLRPLN
jgi:glycosyltransferase involved in cell wall biosynthesis